MSFYIARRYDSWGDIILRLNRCSVLVYCFICFSTSLLFSKVSKYEDFVDGTKYEGESTENLKSAVKIRTTARLSCKFQQ